MNLSTKVVLMVLAGITLAGILGCRSLDTTEPFVNSFESHSN